MSVLESRVDVASPEFGENKQRMDELVAQLSDVFRTRTAGEWLAALEAAAVPCGPIRTIDEVFAFFADAQPTKFKAGLNDPASKGLGASRTSSRPFSSICHARASTGMLELSARARPRASTPALPRDEQRAPEGDPDGAETVHRGIASRADQRA